MNAPANPCADAVARDSAVLEALDRFRDDYVRAYGVDPERLRVLDRLLACRTAVLGMHLRGCEDCGWHGLAYNSCRDRHCPQCQSRDAAIWAAQREKRMLPAPHFQVVFTLPAELRSLAAEHPRFVYDLLLRASAAVLKDLFRERHEGRAGITAVLHTWTSELTYHPHVHTLVTAGAQRHDGSWVETRPAYLFPGKVMGARFRGRFLEALLSALADGTLKVRDPAKVRKTIARLSSRVKRWVVHVEPPKGRGVAAITRYLARYVKRVAISNARMLSVTATHVTFQSRRGPVRIQGVEFVRRFLLHVLPPRLRKVRHYGLYAPGAGGRLERARRLMLDPEGSDSDDPSPAATADEGECCPACGEASVRRFHGDAMPRAFAELKRRARARGPP